MKRRREKTTRRSTALRQETERPVPSSSFQAGISKTARQFTVSAPTKERASTRKQPEHILETFLESFNDGVFEFDYEGKVLNFWGERRAVLHPRAKIALGRRARKVMNKATFDPFRKAFARVLQTGRTETLEYVVNFPHGRRWFLAVISPTPRTHRGRNTISLLARDITNEVNSIQEVQKHEALLTQAEQLARLGSWEYNVESQSFVWSDQMYRMLAREPSDEPISLEQVCAIFHPDDRERVLADVRTIVRERKPLENELRFVLPDGRVRIFHSRALPIADERGRIHQIRGISQDVTDRRDSEEEQRRLSQQLLNVRDEEHRRMARDLHESAAQSLAVLKMTLSRLGEVVPEQLENVRKLVHSSEALAEEAIREVRTVSHLLHPLVLDDAGLGPALRWYARGFAERSQVKAEVQIEDEFGRLSQDFETAVFRIVQEALTNVHRHSGSRTAMIRVARHNGSILVEIEDSGRGMPLPSESTGWRSPLGIGLAGIRQRVKQLQGTFEIKSAPGKGTTVRVVLPLSEGAGRQISVREGK
jgi:PAS domain S-box-containing protein